MRRSRVRFLAALTLSTLAASGCARSGERRFLPRIGSLSPYSTVGSDLSKAPAGTTVTPPSLGVDLVRAPRSDGDGSVTRAAVPVRP